MSIAPTAAAMAASSVVQRRPFLDQIETRWPALRMMTRMPSCFSSCSHSGPVRTFVAGVSRAGGMKPGGERRSGARGERINMDAGSLGLEAERARGCVGLYLVQLTGAAMADNKSTRAWTQLL
jgi:hypothetical protein